MVWIICATLPTRGSLILVSLHKHHLSLNEQVIPVLSVSRKSFIRFVVACFVYSFLFVCIAMAPSLSLKALALLAVALPIVSAIEVAVVSSDATCWQYQGCYNETDTIHPLQFKILPSLTEDTNIENCQSACLAAGYLMSGNADASDCWCDNKLNPASNKIAESYCNVACNTVTTETCGGYSAVSVYDDTCVASPPSPSKTIIITVVPQSTAPPTNIPIHTIYTTVIVTGPVNPQPTRTSVIYVQAQTTTNPYSSSRLPPYRYSRTSEIAAQSTCTDILCCLLNSATCDITQYENGNGAGISLILGATGAPHRRDVAWPTQTSYSTSTSTSTLYSTATKTIVETISVSTTICPETETGSSVAASSAPAYTGSSAASSNSSASVSSGGYIALTGTLSTSAGVAAGTGVGSGSENATVVQPNPSLSPSLVVQGAARKISLGAGVGGVMLVGMGLVLL
ncbi:hypothetical protein L207DRAFT_642351 [Hyaloscypha variabilis F]|uniref:WSC domain-containing protein n=1 Tax=Hyaloscypha variabilis (strain UAMH 11265 / GT02V1 / F) TaxID=1149755 RepID=A0A2J6QTJ9_HYAVF|nr:hypothetical protein L207DRAFT_642351 [Hyaloscypha variabilis F]